MRLSDLHSSTLIQEGLDPRQEEKLAYVHMMLARQGKDAESIMKRVRGLIDPRFAKREGQRATLQRWVSSANPGDTRAGTAFGRKVKVTVLESEIRELIREGKLEDVRKKLSDVIARRREFSYVKRAIQGYASRINKPILDDPKFWNLVDAVTGGLADPIKKIITSTYGEVAESLYSEKVIEEARISEVLRSLGLDRDMVDGLFRQYRIEDEDYDLSRLKGGYASAVEALKNIPKKAGERIAGVAGRAKEAVKQVGREVLQPKVDPKVGPRGGDLKSENMELANKVIKVANALLAIRTRSGEEPEDESRPEIIRPRDFSISQRWERETGEPYRADAGV